MTDTKTTVGLWVIDHLRNKDEIQIAEVAKKALAHFKRDKEFMSTFADYSLELLVKTIVGNTVRNTHIPMGEELLTREAIDNRAKSMPAFNKWLEHAGDRHVIYMEMNRDDLLQAALEREGQGLTQLAIAKLNRTVAKKLGLEQRVKDVFTPEEIEALYKGIMDNKGKLGAGS